MKTTRDITWSAGSSSSGTLGHLYRHITRIKCGGAFPQAEMTAMCYSKFADKIAEMSSLYLVYNMTFSSTYDAAYPVNGELIIKDTSDIVYQAQRISMPTYDILYVHYYKMYSSSGLNILGTFSTTFNSSSVVITDNVLKLV